MPHSHIDLPSAISAKLQIDGKPIDALIIISEGSLEATLTSVDYFSTDFSCQDFVSGITADRKCICLMGILVKRGCGRSINFVGERSSWSSVLTAKFLAISDCSFEPTTSNISGAYILNDQISQICHDPSTLNSVIDPQAAINALVSAQLIEIDGSETGWKSDVQVKLDKGNSFNTIIGSGSVLGVPAFPSLSFSTERRLIDNRYVVGIEFSELTDFYDTLNECTTMVRCCEFSYGIEIVLERLQLTSPDITRVIEDNKQEYPNIVDVYFFDLGFGTRRVSQDAWRSSRLGDWRDALVAPARNRPEFENVITNWFETEPEKSEARARLLDGFRNGSSFPADRLISACSAFELLPQDSKPTKQIPLEVSTLAESIKQTINNSNLDTDWKNRFKQQLGLIKSIRTRDVIEHRLNQIRCSDSDFLPNCEIVLIHAVKLRNRLIHGSPTILSESENIHFQPFFTSVLEVIFVFSELMECGYDIKNFGKANYPQGNPLTVTIGEFDLKVEYLQEALAAYQTS